MGVHLISRDMLQILTALRQFDFLHNMDTSRLKKLASITEIKEFAEGTIIHEAGDLGTAIYLVQEGQVNIEIDVPNHAPVTVLKIGPGQVFGLSSLFPPQRKKGRARVVKKVQALVIDADKLRELFQTDHDLERAFMARTAQIINDRVKATWVELAHKTASGQ